VPLEITKGREPRVVGGDDSRLPVHVRGPVYGTIGPCRLDFVVPVPRTQNSFTG
jgi:hypothetical protein